MNVSRVVQYKDADDSLLQEQSQWNYEIFLPTS